MSRENNIKTNNNKPRNASIELLRIIMMMQIIFLHISEYGNYTKIADIIGGKTELMYWVIWLMCRCPVYIFIIIMGYYLSTSTQGFSRSRILKCYIPMYFYSITIPIIYGIFRPEEINKIAIIKGFFPLISRTWYFMTLYILVLFLSPYLNRMIRDLDRKHFLLLIGFAFCLFSVWQPLSMLEPFESIIGIKKILFTQGGKSLYDFIYMYLLGAYIRRFHIFTTHERCSDNSIWNRPIIYLAGFLLLGLINVFLVYNYPDIGIEDIVGYNDNPLVVMQCLCLFRIFENLDISRYTKLSRCINYISAGNLGIYMIHEHPLIRKLIWEEIFDIDKLSFYSDGIYFIRFIFIIMLIYSSCWIIDWLRRKLFTVVSGKLAK